MKENTKYKNNRTAIMDQKPATPVDRLLQSKICSFFFFKKREKRITLVRSENNWAITPALSFLFFLFLFAAIPSCEKVINVKLTEADKKIVIEGNISNRNEPVEVRISQTKAFEESNAFNGISGATVTIGINDTNYTLVEDEDTIGIYRTTGFKGFSGSTYRLAVLLNGATYSSTSTLPPQLVSVDTLTVENLAFGGSSNLTIYPNYKDPLGSGNSYRLIEYQNGELVKQQFPQNDDLSDGLIQTRPLINPDGDLQSGDTVRVDLQCIDPNVYKYWYSLTESATGDGGSATPANPITNIEGGALGYFSAYSVSSYTIVVP